MYTLPSALVAGTVTNANVLLQQSTYYIHLNLPSNTGSDTILYPLNLYPLKVIRYSNLFSIITNFTNLFNKLVINILLLTL